MRVAKMSIGKTISSPPSLEAAPWYIPFETPISNSRLVQLPLLDTSKESQSCEKSTIVCPTLVFRVDSIGRVGWQCL